jgi:tryptophan 7-halogenase
MLPIFLERPRRYGGGREPKHVDEPLRIVILGGGTAGWMTAAALAALVPAPRRQIRLVESDAIGTVGVGEATLPHMRAFNDAIGLIEADMMRRTGATFKLGIEFTDWGFPGSSYVHPFGAHGRPLGDVAFHHQWQRVRGEPGVRPLEAYSMAIAAARGHCFGFPETDRRSVLSTYDYAYHFDAGLYAAYLRAFAERRGVERTEGRFVDVEVNSASGLIEAVRMESGETIVGDLFVDCTGFRAALAGDLLQTPYEDWSHWLPCDRAFAVPSDTLADLPPYTRSIARSAGWQWQIPLQHRTGNGLIYSSAFISDDDAHTALLAHLPNPATGEPRQLRFQPGRRRMSWSRNCVAIGLSSGFLEPLESTSIYLIQVAVMNLVGLLPRRPDDPVLSAEFNRRLDVEYSRIRDFLILHYHANRREEAMWRHCRDMPIPDSLREKIALFRHRGAVPKYRDGLFSPPSWISVLFGQGLAPTAAHPLAEGMPIADVRRSLERMADEIDGGIAAMSPHAEFVTDYSPAALTPMAGPQ